MQNATLLAFIVSTVISAAAASAAIDDPVRLQDGLIAGVPGAENGVRVFKGIPFAAPPQGDLRWREPQPVQAWTGIRKADAFSKICTQTRRVKGSYFQLEFEPEPEPMGEDCLYLNVWTAAQSPDEKRPVMVWLYGGAFLSGSGSTPAHSGAGLAQKGAIVVTLNYRLGVFGLLAHPELTSESRHNASGNYALMDQIAALKWVQSNIAAFGGNPQNITIFGQSAGSISIAALMTSPLAKGLFQQAIGESDFANGTGPGNAKSRRFTEPRTLREAEQQGLEFGHKVSATTLAELRAMPADDLLKKAAATQWPLDTIIDGYVVPENVYAAYSAGKPIKVPLLVGSVANERGNFPHPESLQGYLDYTRQQFPDAFDEVMSVFPASNDDEAKQTYLSRERDIMAADMRSWAEFMSRNGGHAYLYYFSRQPPARAGETPLGAVHTSDIVYFRNTLDTVDRPWTPQDRKLSDVMSSYLINFATTGNPNGVGLPIWPAYKAGEVMELGDNVGPIPTPDARKLNWLDEYVARQSQSTRSH